MICQVTGLGFAAVARVTEEKWIALAVRDTIGFGLKPGGELEIRSTICDEIRQCREKVVIDHVNEDPDFKDGENYYSDQSDNFFVGNAFPTCGINFTAQEIMGQDQSDQ